MIVRKISHKEWRHCCRRLFIIQWCRAMYRNDNNEKYNKGRKDRDGEQGLRVGVARAQGWLQRTQMTPDVCGLGHRCVSFFLLFFFFFVLFFFIKLRNVLLYLQVIIYIIHNKTVATTRTSPSYAGRASFGP